VARPKRLDNPVVVTFALPSALRVRLRSVAEESGVTMSELLRRYVERALDETSTGIASKKGVAHPGLKAAQMLKFELLRSKVAKLHIDIEESKDPAGFQFEVNQVYDQCLQHLKENIYLTETEVEELSKNLRDLLTALSSKREEAMGSEESS